MVSLQTLSALEVIRAALAESIIGVYLYGSATRGGLRPHSDLDLLVVVDERNVLLTLARIWASLETGRILTKDEAAAWAAERLPAEHRDVLETARRAYLGLASDAAGYPDDAVRALCAHVAEVIGSCTP